MKNLFVLFFLAIIIHSTASNTHILGMDIGQSADSRFEILSQLSIQNITQNWYKCKNLSINVNKST